MSPRAYILAGGESRRLGRDKALVCFEGEALARRVASRLEPLFGTPTLIAPARPGYEALGLRRIADQRPGLGPLAGLESALLDARDQGASVVLLVACDMPFVDPELLARCADAVAEGAQAAAPRLEGRWHGLHAAYALSALDVLRTRLEAGQARVQAFLEALGARDVGEETPAWRRSVCNVNTAEALEEALEPPPPDIE